MSEQIALNYLEIIVAFLLFGVGLPALIYDRPIWLRQIRERNSKVRLVLYVSLAIQVFLVVLVVSYCYDPTHWLSCQEKLISNSITCRARLFGLTKSSWVLPVSVILSLLTTMIWWYYLISYRFDSVLQNLEQRIRNDNAYDKMRDIGELGLNTTSRVNKKSVLKSLNDVAKTVPLKGDDLNHLLEAMHGTLINAGEDSYKLAIEIYQRLITRKLREESQDEAFLNPIMNSIERLGTDLIGFGPAYVTKLLTVIMSAEQPMIREGTLFRLGVTLLKDNQVSNAMQFFSNLEGLVDRNRVAKNDSYNEFDAEQVSLYLGMVAHLYARGGAASTRIWERFLFIWESVGDSRDEWFQMARVYFGEYSADFETEDAVINLQKAVMEHNKRSRNESQITKDQDTM